MYKYGPKGERERKRAMMGEGILALEILKECANRIWQLKKGLSEKNQKYWINAIQNAQKRPPKEFYIQSYIKQVIRIGHFVDVPCYIDNKTLKRFSKRSSFSQALKKKDAGILQMLAATTKNFNSRSVRSEVT